MNVITKLWRIIKTHPISILFYLIYLSFASLVLLTAIRLKKMREPHLTLGEGLMFAYFFLIIIGLIFSLVILINWVVRVNQRRFYGWLLCLIALLPIVIILIGTF